MSNLKLSTISNLAGDQSTAVENAINGSAKAWVNFNGTGTVAIRGSFNVSSITDGGPGNYYINFTTAMPDSNYAITLGGWDDGATPLITKNSVVLGTTSARVYCVNNSTSARDVSEISVAIFR